MTPFPALSHHSTSPQQQQPSLHQPIKSSNNGISTTAGLSKRQQRAMSWRLSSSHRSVSVTEDMTETTTDAGDVYLWGSQHSNVRHPNEMSSSFFGASSAAVLAQQLIVEEEQEDQQQQPASSSPSPAKAITTTAAAASPLASLLSLPVPSTRQELIALLQEKDDHRAVKPVVMVEVEDLGSVPELEEDEDEDEVSVLSGWSQEALDEHDECWLSEEHVETLFADYEDQLRLALQSMDEEEDDGDEEQVILDSLLQEGLFGESDSITGTRCRRRSSSRTMQ